MKRPRTLTAAFVKAVNQPGRYGDGRGGHGLSLLVKRMKNGRWSKSWSQRVSINGRYTNIGLGGYPAVSLSHARDKALQNARAVAEGRDPMGRGIPTFAEAAEAVIELNREAWKTGKTERLWRSVIETYANPHFGHRRVNDVSVADVMLALTPIWHVKKETATRLKQILSQTFRWSMAMGFQMNDPADVATAILPKQNGNRKHHAALAYADVPEAINRIRKADVFPPIRLVLEFIVLTAARSGEARGAAWDEIDLEAALWTLPASRTKSGRVHRVPLSKPACDVLRAAKEHSGDDGLVFPSATGKQISDVLVGKLVRDVAPGTTTHGFRSSFRDWCSETGQPREIAEMCLAHVIGNQTEQAYLRSDLLAKRRELMKAWASFVLHA